MLAPDPEGAQEMCIRDSARIEPGGGRTQYAVDSRGRVVFIVDPAGGAVETRYDAADQIASVITYAEPLGQALGLSLIHI